ncbi:MAG: ABC transporter ATP-binding protein [Acidobacteriota bacterium]
MIADLEERVEEPAAIVPQDPTSAAIAAEGLTKGYGKKAVLSQVSFRVEPGEAFALLGPNGTGKTTLLDILTGLKTPNSGRAWVLGRDPADGALKARRGVQLESFAFPFFAKVKEVIWMHQGFHRGGLDPQTLIEAFQLDTENYVRYLSKGQRQRLSLLLALLGEPELIFLDEPSSGLDPKAQSRLWEILRRAAGDSTLFFSTHDMVEAEQQADRVCILHDGRVVACGSPEQLCREAIGPRRKLVLRGVEPRVLFARGGIDRRHVMVFGSETVLYHDQPEELLRSLPIRGDLVQIQMADVSLRDVFFKLTGRSSHVARSA